MKRKNIHLFIFIAVVSLFTACSSSWDEQYNDTSFEVMPSASINLSKTVLEFSEKASGQQITISTSTYWTAQTSAGWLHISSTMGKGDATLSITVDSNIGSTQSRSAVITIKNGVESHNVNVNQNGVAQPSISAVQVADITKHSATLSFSYSSTNVAISEYGICYSSTAKSPSIDNATTIRRQEGGMEGNPSFDVSGLASKTTYYVRAYIVSSLGTQYSETIEFTTQISTPNEGDNGTPQD